MRIYRIWKVRKLILIRYKQLISIALKNKNATLEDRLRVDNSIELIDYIDGHCDIKGKYYGK